MKISQQDTSKVSFLSHALFGPNKQLQFKCKIYWFGHETLMILLIHVCLSRLGLTVHAK